MISTTTLNVIGLLNCLITRHVEFFKPITIKEIVIFMILGEKFEIWYGILGTDISGYQAEILLIFERLNGSDKGYVKSQLPLNGVSHMLFKTIDCNESFFSNQCHCKHYSLPNLRPGMTGLTFLWTDHAICVSLYFHWSLMQGLIFFHIWLNQIM